MHEDFALTIEQHPVRNYWKTRGGFLPVAIVEHMMQGTLEDTRQFFDGDVPGGENYAVSAHYGIGRDGRVWQFVPDEDTAWANGVLQQPDLNIGWLKEVYEEEVNCNLVTISLEYEGFSGEPLTEAQYHAALALHRRLVKQWDIEPDPQHIIGHDRIDTLERHSNPGPAFPWDRLFQDLQPAPAPHDPAATEEASRFGVPLAAGAPDLNEPFNLANPMLPGPELSNAGGDPASRAPEEIAGSASEPESVATGSPQVVPTSFQVPPIFSDNLSSRAARGEDDPASDPPDMELPVFPTDLTAGPAWDTPNPGLEPFDLFSEGSQSGSGLPDFLSDSPAFDAEPSGPDAPNFTADSLDFNQTPGATFHPASYLSGSQLAADHDDFSPAGFETDATGPSFLDDFPVQGDQPARSDFPAAPVAPARFENVIELPDFMAEPFNFDELKNEAPLADLLDEPPSFRVPTGDLNFLSNLPTLPGTSTEPYSLPSSAADTSLAERNSGSTTTGDQTEITLPAFPELPDFLEEVPPPSTPALENQADQPPQLPGQRFDFDTADPLEQPAAPQDPFFSAEPSSGPDLQEFEALYIEDNIAGSDSGGDEATGHLATDGSENALPPVKFNLTDSGPEQTYVTTLPPETTSGAGPTEPPDNIPPPAPGQYKMADFSFDQPTGQFKLSDLDEQAGATFSEFNSGAITDAGPAGANPATVQPSGFSLFEETGAPTPDLLNFAGSSGQPGQQNEFLVEDLVKEAQPGFASDSAPLDLENHLPTGQFGAPPEPGTQTALPPHEASHFTGHGEDEQPADKPVSPLAAPALPEVEGRQEEPEPASFYPFDLADPPPASSDASQFYYPFELPSGPVEGSSSGSNYSFELSQPTPRLDEQEEPVSNYPFEITTGESQSNQPASASAVTPGSASFAVPLPEEPIVDQSEVSAPVETFEAFPMPQPASQLPDWQESYSASNHEITPASKPDPHPPASIAPAFKPPLPGAAGESQVPATTPSAKTETPPIGALDDNSELGLEETSAEDLAKFERMMAEAGATLPASAAAEPASPSSLEPSLKDSDLDFLLDEDFPNFSFDENALNQASPPPPLDPPTLSTTGTAQTGGSATTPPEISATGPDFEFTPSWFSDLPAASAPPRPTPLPPFPAKNDNPLLDLTEDDLAAIAPFLSPAEVSEVKPPAPTAPTSKTEPFTRAAIGGGSIAVELANLRTSPSFGQETILREAEFGERFDFDGWSTGPELRGSGYWLHISPASGGGWVHSALVQLDRPFTYR